MRQQTLVKKCYIGVRANLSLLEERDFDSLSTLETAVIAQFVPSVSFELPSAGNDERVALKEAAGENVKYFDSVEQVEEHCSANKYLIVVVIGLKGQARDIPTLDSYKQLFVEKVNILWHELVEFFKNGCNYLSFDAENLFPPSVEQHVLYPVVQKLAIEVKPNVSYAVASVDDLHAAWVDKGNQTQAEFIDQFMRENILDISASKQGIFARDNVRIQVLQREYDAARVFDEEKQVGQLVVMFKVTNLESTSPESIVFSRSSTSIPIGLHVNYKKLLEAALLMMRTEVLPSMMLKSFRQPVLVYVKVSFEGKQITLSDVIKVVADESVRTYEEKASRPSFSVVLPDEYNFHGPVKVNYALLEFEKSKFEAFQKLLTEMEERARGGSNDLTLAPGWRTEPEKWGPRILAAFNDLWCGAVVHRVVKTSNVFDSELATKLILPYGITMTKSSRFSPSLSCTLRIPPRQDCRAGLFNTSRLSRVRVGAKVDLGKYFTPLILS